uniref:Vacuolar protein sorting-associated protein 18 homolog n=1 Tax=Parastrongyloides trichosuri TaxID=131310 RepID=A0A0N4ZI99_PARTI
MRLNTDLRQKSYDKRPILARAQSMAAGAVASLTGNNSELNFGENGSNKESSYSNLTTQDSPSISSSLEKLSLYETITFVEFISSILTKNSTKLTPTIYIGTSSGVCLAYTLNIPTNRITTNVSISHVICAQKLKGEMLYCCFMDETFRLLGAPSESYKETTSDSPKSTQNKIITKTSLSPTISNSTDSSNGMDDINQVSIIVTESEARTISLPGCCTLFSYKPDRSFVKVQASHVNGQPILMILNEAGEMVVLSLPSLKFLYKSQLFSKSVDLDDPMISKITFSDYGLGFYMVTPSELQKFTISRELASQISECSGEVFIPKDMPEQPKPSLLQGVSTLFGGGTIKDASNLEAIFNDKDNKNGQGLVTMKSIARTIQTPALNNMEHAQSRGVTAGQAAQMAIQNLNERTDKLNAVVDATENLKNNAQSLASRSGKLAEKLLYTESTCVGGECPAGYMCVCDYCCEGCYDDCYDCALYIQYCDNSNYCDLRQKCKSTCSQCRPADYEYP